MILRDILSVRLENRARLIRMAVQGEAPLSLPDLAETLLNIAAELDADARAVGRLEQKMGQSA